MADIGFSPSAWQKAGRAYEQAGSDLVSGVAAHLSVLDVSQLGCERGAHLVDQALALVVPTVKEAFDQACKGLASNMRGVGEAMTDTGLVYRKLEDDQTSLAVSITEGL